MKKGTFFVRLIVLIAVIVVLVATYYFNSKQSILTTTTTTTTYTSQYPIKILSINTIPSSPQVNDSIFFNVTFQNIANHPIYYVAGCGSSLEISSFNPNNSIQKNSYYRCLCYARLTILNPNEIATSWAPNCVDGYNLKILKLGTITFNLTLFWGTSQDNLDSSTSLPYSINVNSINTATTTTVPTNSSGTVTVIPTSVP